MGKAAFNSLHLLIVDDNVHMRHIIETLIRALGVRRVSLVSDGDEALGLLRSVPVDIVLCDLEMDHLNGLEFIRKVRVNDASPNPYVPIIVVSGHTDKRSVIKARDAGAHEFLAKPISAKELYSRLIAVIERPRPFIRTKTYFGPDRRRRLEDFYSGTDRRGDGAEAAADGDPGALDSGDLELILSDSIQPSAATGD